MKRNNVPKAPPTKIAKMVLIWIHPFFPIPKLYQTYEPKCKKNYPDNQNSFSKGNGEKKAQKQNLGVFPCFDYIVTLTTLH